MNKYSKAFLLVLLFSVIAFAAHFAAANLIGFSDRWKGTGYTLQGLYSLQTVLSLFVVGMIFLAQWAMPKNLGFIFLALIFLKAIAGYVYIKDGLEMANDKFLALQFLVTYFLFLFMDVFMAYRAINQVEPNPGTKF